MTKEHPQKYGLQQGLWPHFLHVVKGLYEHSGDFVQRPEIVQELINRPTGCALLLQAYDASSRTHTFEWYVGNQIDWISANWTKEILPERDKLKRQRVNGRWAYKPA
jgi:hypothetical protein